MLVIEGSFRFLKFFYFFLHLSNEPLQIVERQGQQGINFLEKIPQRLMIIVICLKLSVRDIKKRILQFTNLKFTINAKEPLKTPF